MREKRYMMTAGELANELGISKAFAYKLIREMNNDLRKAGYVVISGRVPKTYMEKRFYGYEKG